MSEPKTKAQKPTKRRVQHVSPGRLLRQPVTLPGGVIISAEQGRLVVRFEVPENER